MKTKLTLFVAVLAVALCGMGCSSMGEVELRQPVVHLTEVTVNMDDGLYYAKDSKETFTGTIQEMHEGKINRELQVQDGLLHGYYRAGNQHQTGEGGQMKYDGGKLIFRQNWDKNGKLLVYGRFKLDGDPIVKVTDDNPRQPLVHLSAISTKDGLYYAKDPKETFTGTIQEIRRSDGTGGMMMTEFQVQDGLLHGYHRVWDRHSFGLEQLTKYDRGKLVFRKNWGRNGKQMELEAFNLDGTPKFK